MSLSTAFSLLSGTAAVFLSFLFGQSIASKVADMDAFTAAIDAYQLLPTDTGRFAARGLVAIEFLAGAAMLVPISRPGGAFLAIALLIGYAAAMAVNLGRGRHDIDCGCGGARQSISHVLVMRNVLLAAIGIPLLSAPAIPLGLAEIVLVGVSGTTLWLGWTVAEQLQANSTRLNSRSKGRS